MQKKRVLVKSVKKGSLERSYSGGSKKKKESVFSRAGRKAMKAEKAGLRISKKALKKKVFAGMKADIRAIRKGAKRIKIKPIEMKIKKRAIESEKRLAELEKKAVGKIKEVAAKAKTREKIIISGIVWKIEAIQKDMREKKSAKKAKEEMEKKLAESRPAQTAKPMPEEKEKHKRLIKVIGILKRVERMAGAEERKIWSGIKGEARAIKRHEQEFVKILGRKERDAIGKVKEAARKVKAEEKIVMAGVGAEIDVIKREFEKIRLRQEEKKEAKQEAKKEKKEEAKGPETGRVVTTRIEPVESVKMSKLMPEENKKHAKKLTKIINMLKRAEGKAKAEEKKILSGIKGEISAIRRHEKEFADAIGRKERTTIENLKRAAKNAKEREKAAIKKAKDFVIAEEKAAFGMAKGMADKAITSEKLMMNGIKGKIVAIRKDTRERKLAKQAKKETEKKLAEAELAKEKREKKLSESKLAKEKMEKERQLRVAKMLAESRLAKEKMEKKREIKSARLLEEKEALAEKAAAEKERLGPVLEEKPERIEKPKPEMKKERPEKIVKEAAKKAIGKKKDIVSEIKEEVERELKGNFSKGNGKALSAASSAASSDKAIQIAQQRKEVLGVLKRAVHPPKEASGKYVATGIAGLDGLMEDGIPTGSTVLVAGGAGSGKTILCLQILNNHALKGEKCLYMSFEESKERLHQHMEDFGWKPKELEAKGNLLVHRFSPFEITRSVDALLMKAKGELLIDVDPVILPENFKPDFIVVDSLTAIASAFSGKEDSYRIYIEQLFMFFERIGATAFLVTETKQIPTIFSQTGVEEFLADGVIVLYSIRKGNVRENAIEVLKLRGAEHKKKIVAMQITEKGVVVYPDQEVFSGIEEVELI